MADVIGICRLCEQTGTIGTACRGEVCLRHGFHHIPMQYFQPIREKSFQHSDQTIGLCIDEHLVVSLLGVGGFGKVYLALQLPLLMPVALKLMLGDGVGQSTARRFQDEALSLSQLNHPGIVRLLKYGTHGGMPYMVMEFVTGACTLKDEIAQRAAAGRAFEPALIRHILGQTLNALEAAHRQGIVHRDIKPENIMLQRVVGDDYFVRVLDFGLAKFVDRDTESSTLAGTPTYMAPEQLKRGPVGPWTDLYALGVIFFELFTGQRPFPGQTVQEILSQKLDPGYDPFGLVPNLMVPREMHDFVRQAMAFDHHQRFQGVDAFRAALFGSLAALGSDETQPAPLAAAGSEALAADQHHALIQSGASSGAAWTWVLLVFMIVVTAAVAVVLLNGDPRSARRQGHDPGPDAQGLSRRGTDADRPRPQRRQPHRSFAPVPNGLSAPVGDVLSPKVPVAPRRLVRSRDVYTARPERPRTVRIRPVYRSGGRTLVLDGVAVLVDGRLLGTTTAGRGVTWPLDRKHATIVVELRKSDIKPLRKIVRVAELDSGVLVLEVNFKW